MTLQILFAILMLLWLLLGAAPLLKTKDSSLSGVGAFLLPWAAVAVVGWAVFGPLIRG